MDKKEENFSWGLCNNIQFLPRSNQQSNFYIIKGGQSPIAITTWMHELISFILKGYSPQHISHLIQEQFNMEISPDKITNEIIPYLYNKKVLTHYGEQNFIPVKFDESEENPGINGYWHQFLRLRIKSKFISNNYSTLLAKYLASFIHPKTVPLVLTTAIFSIIICILPLFQNGLLLNPARFFPIIAVIMPLFFIANIASAFLHELGHVATAYRVGCPVGEIGVGIYLFNPVMYTRLTQAYYLEKKDRILINIGGIYFESVLLIVFALFALYLNSDILALITINIGAGIIKNLSPFTKLDGYWLLSDWLEIPNLHQRLESAVRSAIKNKKAPMGIEGIVLLSYGILSAVYIFISTAMLYWILPTYIASYPALLLSYWTEFVNEIIIGHFLQTIWQFWLIINVLVPVIGFCYLIKVITTFFLHWWKHKRIMVIKCSG